MGSENERATITTELEGTEVRVRWAFKDCYEAIRFHDHLRAKMLEGDTVIILGAIKHGEVA